MFFLLLSFSLSGCALAPFKETPWEASSTPEARFVTESMTRAKDLEAAKQLPAAWRQYKIALTVRPNDREAQEGRERVEKALRKGAEEHYRAGLRMQKEGNQAQAFKHCLTALRLWPEHREALQMATAGMPVAVDKLVAQKIPAEPQIKEPPQGLYAEEEEDLALPEKLRFKRSKEKSLTRSPCIANTGWNCIVKANTRRLCLSSARCSARVRMILRQRTIPTGSSFELALELFQKKEYLAASRAVSRLPETQQQLPTVPRLHQAE